MPPEAFQDHSDNMSAFGQFPYAIEVADSSEFADNAVEGYSIGVQSDIAVDHLARPEDLAVNADYIRQIGGNLRQIREVVGEFDTPGTHELPAGFGHAFRGGIL